MAKTPAFRIYLELQELQKRLSAGFTDREIIADLKLSEKTFQRYKTRLNKLYAEIAAKETEDVIEFEAEILKERYIRLYRNLEARITKADDSEDLDAIANATEVATLIATNIFRLKVEGLKARQARLELKNGEQKAIRYLGLANNQGPEPDQSIESESEIPVSDIAAAAIISDDSRADSQRDEQEESGGSDNQVQE